MDLPISSSTFLALCSAASNIIVLVFMYFVLPEPYKKRALLAVVPVAALIVIVGLTMRAEVASRGVEIVKSDAPSGDVAALKDQVATLERLIAEMRKSVPSSNGEGGDERVAVGGCDDPASRTIAKFLRGCEHYEVCPQEVVLAEVTAYEYRAMMSRLRHVAVFFETGSSAMSAGGAEHVSEFVTRLARRPTTIIIVARASKPGSVDLNRRLSRERALAVGAVVERHRERYASIAFMSYGEETLYLTDDDARVYGISPKSYQDVEHLNQSVFLFAFDCGGSGSRVAQASGP